MSFRYGPAVLWAAGIWIASSSAASADSPQWLRWLLNAMPSHLHLDKLIHLTVFAVLAWLIRAPSKSPPAQAAWVALALTATWGAIDEVHQAFVPGRSADVLDWCADCLGGALSVSLYHRWPRPNGAQL